MTNRLEGKAAFITGAARGQGRAHAVRMAAEGADILALDICGPLPDISYPCATAADLDETARRVRALGRRIISVAADVRDLDAMREFVDSGVAELGRLDIVVANAGICTPKPWDQVTAAMFDNALSINVTGVWNTVMVGAPHLVRAGGGSVILISSAAGLKVQPYMIPYTTSKFAVRGMAKAFAAELADDGIRVNSVHPTGVRTPMGEGGIQQTLAECIADNPRPAGMFTNLLPVDIIDPEDVAEAVLFLASDESRYVTAHELAVDAGVTQF
ncbi:mycofactocin-coupled SDR family oxidoreductase [Nocardia cyriacigeorgica]|uniref:mycofactocin-coupled SDR family oxidoreductase n=1 Tax=Nocardia cyriacigeorgica TaxID=135487 RepID=UPI0024582515|nr:mycofactocin-coupled SDR family oxidoreductase [Nocardia cyriacigeorgica]